MYTDHTKLCIHWQNMQFGSRKIHITKWVTSESYLNDFETIFGYEI